MTCNGATVIVMLNDCVAVCAAESVTLAVKLKEPVVVGVPEIVPAAERVSPAGKAPELILQLYGVVPPLAAKVVV